MAENGDGEAKQGEGKGRNILLFSDGTGNSSSSQQKTNVWRLYEALDLGPPQQAGDCEQIAYYDNGVGTSNFRPLAMLGGIFGFGLARNVRDIYKFLCRNYHDGDRIYAFGFSRGAYTIRLLAALVCVMGVAPYEGEEELDLVARDVWREARREFHTNNFFTDFLVCALRALARSVTRFKRLFLGEPSNYRFMADPSLGWFAEWTRHWFEDRRVEPVEKVYASKVDGLAMVELEFVGVWDTVAAYGGPIVELTRAIDEWIWPLTMPNYRLHPAVKVARHALAIDDKRDAFHPLLWDEVNDREQAARLANKLEHEGERAGAVTRLLAERYNSTETPRLQQVWFAGMHADVGGGYADDSLSYVSLWWMIEHATQAGVRLIADSARRIADFRNIFGPLHNSRAGVGAFYRYQPRYINAWIDHDPQWHFETYYPRSRVRSHVQPATQIFRDPTIARGRHIDRGLLNYPISLHESVEDRLRLATDGYAPNNLPARYLVDLGIGGTRPAATKSNAGEEIAQARLEILWEMGNRIKLRRFWYFMTLALIALLATRPYWPGLPVLDNFVGTVDDRTNAQLIEAAVAGFLPGFLGNWLHALFADLFTSLAMVVLIFVAMAFGLGHERAMADISRSLWRSRFAGRKPEERRILWFERPGQAIAGYFARSDELQAILAFVKWRIVPWLLGLVLLAAILYAVLAGSAQLWLARLEARPATCLVGDLADRALLDGRSFESEWIDIRKPCSDLAVLVASGRTYHIVVDMADENGRRILADASGKPLLAGLDGKQVAGDAEGDRSVQDPKGYWFDASHPATPEGWVEDNWISLSSRYFRRVVSAPLMAPILEYRPIKEEVDGLGRWWKFLVGVPSYLSWPGLEHSSAESRWEGDFTTPGNESAAFNAEEQGGPEVAGLHAFVNDAMMFDGWGRYRNNHGKMRICLWPQDLPEDQQPCRPAPAAEAVQPPD